MLPWRSTIEQQLLLLVLAAVRLRPLLGSWPHRCRRCRLHSLLPTCGSRLLALHQRLHWETQQPGAAWGIPWCQW